MFGYFLLGLFLIAAAVILLQAGRTVSRAQVWQFVRYLAAGLAALFGVVGLVTGRPVWAVVGLGGAVAVALLGRHRGTGNGGGKAPGASDVETTYLRMRLDHDSGAISGEVLAGRHQGRRIEEMAVEEVVDLLAECLAADPQGAQLLEAYLDRAEPDWRERSQAAGAEAQGPMSRDEAYKVLGLQPGASATEVRAAHRRLMKHHHPDSGGSTYLAAKINEAKDVLLGRG
jgi:hypothetical protein